MLSGLCRGRVAMPGPTASPSRRRNLSACPAAVGLLPLPKALGFGSESAQSAPRSSGPWAPAQRPGSLSDALGDAQPLRRTDRPALRPPPVGRIATALTRTRREARIVIEAWRRHYNAVRTHSSLNYLTPVELSQQHRVQSLIPNLVQERPKGAASQWQDGSRAVPPGTSLGWSPSCHGGRAWPSRC